jgi:hypothetical protein
MLILYQRDDCKLCDQAVALLARARAPDFESVWIDGDAELETRLPTPLHSGGGGVPRPPQAPE